MAFALAASVSAAVAGATLGALGSVLLRDAAGTPAAAWGAGIVAALAALTDAGVLRLPFPNTWRQVPRSWSRRYPPLRVAILYGAELGLGVTTHVQLLAFYGVPVWAFLSGHPGSGALVFGCFGLVRGLAIAAVDVGGAKGEELDGTLLGLAVYERIARFGGGLVATAAASALVFSAAG